MSLIEKTGRQCGRMCLICTCKDAPPVLTHGPKSPNAPIPRMTQTEGPKLPELNPDADDHRATRPRKPHIEIIHTTSCITVAREYIDKMKEREEQINQLNGALPQLQRPRPKVIVGVDFDGTCVLHEFPKVGPDAPDAVDVLHRLVACGASIILFTMRSGDSLLDAVNWFANWRIPLYGVNENPDQKSWTTSPKPYCHLYIDDAGLGCPTKKVFDHLDQELRSERPVVDWYAVDQILGRYPWYKTVF